MIKNYHKYKIFLMYFSTFTVTQAIENDFMHI